MSSLQKRLSQAGGRDTITATAALAKMNERPRDVRLGDITLDLGLQFRLDVKDGVDEKHVLDLMNVIADGQDTDPVILYRVDAALLMADGFHRYEAYRRSNRATILAIVRDGTYQDAEEAAENANLQFKKALGDESKKYIFARRVQRGYKTNGISWQQLSNKAIAAELGVSPPTINAWFNELHLEGVKFFTPSNQEVLIRVSCDRAVVYGRDGNPINVEAMRESATQRAAAASERRATEETERKRNLPAVDKLRVIVEMLIAKYSKRYAEKGQPFFDDPAKSFKWCQQVSNPTFVTGTDWEIQFLKEYGAKPVGMYQEFLRLGDQATFIEAEMDSWTDEQLADWVASMRQHPPRGGYGMAQPKHPDTTYQQTKTLGRHVISTPSTTAAATEPAVEEHTEPSHPCPFRMGQNVEVLETGEMGIVHMTQYVNHEWVIQVELYEGLKAFKAHEIGRPFRDTVHEALNAPAMGAAAAAILDEMTDDEPVITPAAETTNLIPFRAGDIVRDVQTGAICEVIGFSDDGSVVVETEDEDGNPYQYNGWAEDFERYQLDAPVPSNGKRQAEIMIQDARSIIPRLVLDTTNATVDYRTTILVRWESPKSIQTILENGDPSEINFLSRDLRRLQGEANLAVKLLDQMLGNLDAMLAEIEAARA